MANYNSVIFLTLVSLACFTSVDSAVFENVTVSLTTELTKLYVYGRPPIDVVLIQSSNTLGEYVNLQPLEIVTIQNERVPFLKENSVGNLPNIIHVSIISCRVKRVEPGAFQNVPKLDSINLDSNLIETIEDGVFTNLRVRSVYLNNNKIVTIGNAAFNNMTLTTLSLNNNKISKWNSDWFVGTPVNSIYLSNNLLEVLPANAFAFGWMFKKVNVPLLAWHIDFSKNRLKKIHPDAFTHINGFMYLSFADNYLGELSPNLFKSVKQINTLDFSDNRIANVERIFDDITVNQLILINNTLSCFPTNVFDVSRINFIFLDGNPLTCGCVQMWKHFQMQNNALVVYNMENLERNCVQKN
jgi:hypothetical protein